MPKSKRAPVITGDQAVIDSPRSQADRLFRAAAECVRQRQRYSWLVDAAAQDEEQVGALRIVCICDEVLTHSAAAYEAVASSDATQRDEDWCRRANSLWHATREYERRHQGCDEQAKKFSNHNAQHLRNLAMDYDLEASALLALQHAVTAYRKTVPSAEIDAPTPARVA